MAEFCVKMSNSIDMSVDALQLAHSHSQMHSLINSRESLNQVVGLGLKLILDKTVSDKH
jgi:hypothetical protein